MSEIFQGIVTRYHGPTSTRGARISATTASGIRRYYPYQYGLGSQHSHAAAAQDLAEYLGWKGTWRGGSVPGGYAFVLDDGAIFTIPGDDNR